MSKLIKQNEHYCDAENDRWILIVRDYEGTIIGLNFMQGHDYDLFQKDYGKADPALSALHKTILEHKIVEGSMMEVINKVCWAWINLRTGSANEVATRSAAQYWRRTNQKGGI